MEVEVGSIEFIQPVSSVAVLDAGGQYVDLVVKAIERQGHRTVLLPLNTTTEQLEQHYGAVVVSGSPANSGETGEVALPDPDLWNSKLPVLGICFGMQAMALQQGGSVTTGVQREDGRKKTNVDIHHPLFIGSKAEQTALFTHGDFVTTLPDGFKSIGSHTIDDETVYSAIANGNKIGVQFHPEIFDDTPEGYSMFGKFLHNIAGLEPDEGLVERRIQETIDTKRAEIKTKVGDKHVIAFMSGGVDSSVASVLASDVISDDKFHAYYIDNGLMRDEDEAVIDLLRHTGISVAKVDASDLFLGALENVSDPREKRKIIGRLFVEVQNQLVTELGLHEDQAMLLQGTNAADRIESGHSKGDSHTEQIKEHHNQVKEVKDLEARGLLIEPLDDLFKDEVRALGKSLGLPYELVQRHPFPGPGLGIRVLCNPGGEIASSGAEGTLNGLISQIQTEGIVGRLVPVQSVGVGGDERSYLSAAVLQGVHDWAKAEQLQELPHALHSHINRVLVALTDQPVDQLGLTTTFLGREELAQLRHADRIVFEEMRRSGLIESIIQFPVVLLPLGSTSSERSIVLRPVTTSTFMTVQAMLPERDLPLSFIDTCAQRIISEVADIGQVFLDITNKPPATTEFE